MLDGKARYALVLMLLTGLVGPAVAQTPLRLLQQGREAQAQNGRSFPKGTEVAVVDYTARSPQPVSDTVVSREGLSRRILTHLESRVRPTHITSEGVTSTGFRPTSQSGQVLYVLARTPDERLYESFVSSPSEDTLVPGFDPVRTGVMRMRRVPRSARRRMRSAFELGAGRVLPSRPSLKQPSPKQKTAQESRTGSEEGDVAIATGVGRGDGSTDETNVLLEMLAGLAAGVLVGVGGTWYIFSRRLQRVKDKRDKLKHALQKQKGKDFREAIELRGARRDEKSSSRDVPSSDGSPTQMKVEHLNEENDRLRRENKSLREEIREIREHLQNLRGGNE